MTPTPDISIITICRNAGATIERTLQSVRRCTYPRLQYVIVDGGSTDDTLQVIERYRSGVHKLISEPDRGISDALNKAIELTDSEYHLLVHADDVLLPGAVEALAAASAPGHPQVVCGAVRVMNSSRLVRRFVANPAQLTQKMSVPHMGALLRKDAWRAVGGYDLTRRIAMDHLLMLRILRRFGLEAFQVVDYDVAEYNLGGLSDKLVKQGFRELRDNLIAEGGGTLSAQLAYLKLLLKSRVARLLGGA
jgi:glycosyltransferase involved in cell wall biosynthesis